MGSWKKGRGQRGDAKKDKWIGPRESDKPPI